MNNTSESCNKSTGNGNRDILDNNGLASYEHHVAHLFTHADVACIDACESAVMPA